ncbi:MAG: hypothetical protein IJB36_06490 [Clostridia bacterium]|nr:hypothetical protein [Clostridia bacterium]
MKKTTNRILSVAFALLLLLGVLPLSVAAEYELWDGSEMTVTMKAGEERFFLYIPSESGPHTISQSTSVIRVDFHQEDESDKDAFPELLTIQGKANPNDECYRLKGGARYLVRMHVWEGETEWPDGITDTISIHPGEPKKEVDLCTPFPNSGELKITVKPGEEFKYKFTPAESGRYVLYGGNTVIDVRLRHGVESLDMPDNQLMIANPFGVMHGYMADMTAGETYIITFSMWEGSPDKEGFTDTYHLEKVGAMTSAELRSAYDHTTTDLYGYVGGHMQLFPYTKPLYFEAFTTAWTVSDPSVARFITEDSKQTRELELLKAGTVTVTATVNGQAVSKTITVKDRPKLELNKTTKLTFGGSLGVECSFTPAESGSYRFYMAGAGGTAILKGTGYATYVDNIGSLTAPLTAGKTYILEGAFDPGDCTIQVLRSGANDPTDPAPPSGDEPTDPTETPSATEPSETTPSQTTGTTGKQPSHKVPVHKENGKAQVKYEDVAHLLNPDSNKTLTVAVEDAGITTVALPTQLLTEAAQSDKTVQVILPHATVTLDASVLATAAEAAQGDTVELTAEPYRVTDLTVKQQNTLQNKNVAAVIRLSLNGGEEIHDLGGMAAVTVPFTPEKGKKAENYTVYYLSPDGKLEKMKTTVGDGELTFLTRHFSDYTVMYEATKSASGKKSPADIKVLFVVLPIIALLLLIGGGVAIYFITKKVQK